MEILKGCSYGFADSLVVLADLDLTVTKVQTNHCLRHFALIFFPYSFTEPMAAFAIPTSVKACQSFFAEHKTGSGFEEVTHITSKCCVSSQILF